MYSPLTTEKEAILETMLDVWERAFLTGAELTENDLDCPPDLSAWLADGINARRYWLTLNNGNKCPCAKCQFIKRHAPRCECPLCLFARDDIRVVVETLLGTKSRYAQKT